MELLIVLLTVVIFIGLLGSISTLAVLSVNALILLWIVASDYFHGRNIDKVSEGKDD